MEQGNVQTYSNKSSQREINFIFKPGQLKISSLVLQIIFKSQEIGLPLKII